MPDISLKKFVDINLKQHITSAVIGTRSTVALFSPEGTSSTIKTIEKLSDATYANTTATYKYLKVFFDNGGAKVNVYEGYTQAPSEEVIKALPNNIICVAYASDTATYATMKTKATAINADTSVYGINEKLLFARENEDTIPQDIVKNLIVKHSSIIGAEMTIAAYLSQINVYHSNTVYDYMFTIENIDAEDITNTLYESIINNNENVDINLANAVRNCGGNCKDGADITNTFVRIILHQTLTNKLVNLLSQKIKSSSGIGKIYSTIAQELEYYLQCGYLTTDDFWKDDDLVITRNGIEYTIISKGDALTNGYLIKVLPLSALTDSEKANREAPPIYIIIADQYGIRKITINGEII